MTIDSLNPEQRLAIEHVYGPLLVVAGAGSGKTRVVTERIAHLIRSGVHPDEILALTFTNKAAEEMQQRIRKNALQPPLVTTFHSFGSRFLREWIDLFGFSNRFLIYDTDDSEQLLKLCVKEILGSVTKSTVTPYKKGISEAKNQLKLPEDLSNSFSYLTAFKEIYSLYQEKLKISSAIDFDDLLLLPYLLLSKEAHVRQRTQERYRFVLIDEYQDTNPAQYALFRLLIEQHGNGFVVGDPDQSIYSWRGASIRNILEFQQDFPKAKVVKLEQNYRSRNHILQAANHLICRNESRYEKNLWSALGDGEKVHVIDCWDEREEANYIAKKVLELWKMGTPLSHIALLYRTNAQSRVLEDRLLREKIPYTIVGGISFYERKEVKDLIAYLKFALSGNDRISFERAIYTPRRGLGEAAIKEILNLSDLRGVPLAELIQEEIPQWSKKKKESLAAFGQVIREIQSTQSVSKALELILEKTGYLESLKQEDPESFLDRRENIEALISKAMEWDEEFPEGSLFEFLEEVSLRQALDTLGTDSLLLMTLHNSKGLEFPVCFLLGLEEELLPHANAIQSHDLIEEERRLCYVGMTRAKEKLVLTYARNRLFFDGSRPMKRSRFLQELPKEHVVYFRS